MPSLKYLACALRWAEDRWFLTEHDVVEEWVRRAHADYPDPTELVDYYAEQYGLHDYSGPFDKPIPDRKEYQP